LNPHNSKNSQTPTIHAVPYNYRIKHYNSCKETTPYNMQYSNTQAYTIFYANKLLEMFLGSLNNIVKDKV